jgi:hypothetical protein
MKRWKTSISYWNKPQEKAVTRGKGESDNFAFTLSFGFGLKEWVVPFSL